MNHATRFMRLALALVLVGALALAGCGGDDNGGISADDMARIDNAEAAAAAAMAAQATAEAEAAAAMAAQMEAEADAATAMAAQMEAEADAAAAMAAQATAEMNATAAIAAQAVAESEAMTAKAALTEAQEDLDAAEMALAAANEAKTMAETAQAVAESEAKAAMAAQTAAEAAQATAEAAQKVAEDAKTAADAALTAAQAERDKYKLMYEEATAVPTVGTQVGAEGRANSWRIDSAQSVAAGMIKKGVSADKLMRDDAGVSFTVMEGTLARMTTADDMADDAAPSLTGWQGTALAKTSGGTTQNALVYTDIERSVTPFSSKHPYTVDDGGTPPDTGAPTYVHTGVTGAVSITGPRAHDFISLNHAVSSANPDQNVAADGTIRGSYDGVPGVYTCAGNAAACPIMWAASGVTVTVPTGQQLLFQADDISTLIPDPDHLTFGVWMIAQDGPVTGNSGAIRPIAMANAGTFSQEDLAGMTAAEDPLKGSATYTGQAAGYYATRDAGSFEAESGRFTATATLKANFDAAADTVPATQDSDLATVQRAGDAASLSAMALDADRAPETATPADVAYYRPVVARSGVSFAGSKIDQFMAEDGTMMEGWVVNLNGGVLRQPADVMVADNAGIPDDGTTTITENSANGQRAIAYNAALEAARNASTFEGMTSGTSGAMEWSGIWDASLHGNTKAALPTGVVGTFQADAGMAVPKLEAGAINLSTDTGFAGVIGSFGARR